MKDSYFIISHLKNSPRYKKIKTQECFESIKSILPKHLKNAILFMYTKNQTLFFVLNHPGFKMEFNYNLNLIKGLLKEVKKHKSCCKELPTENIKVFVSNKIDKKNQRPNNSDIKYKERSNAEFENPAKNKSIAAAFEQIRKTISKKIKE